MAKPQINVWFLGAGIILLVVAILPIISGGSSGLGFGSPKDIITCDATIKNPALQNPTITTATCTKTTSTSCFLPFSLYTALGIQDEGTIKMSIDGNDEDKAKYSIFETESRTFTLKSGCLPQGTHQVKFILFDDTGGQIGNPTTKTV